jgi:hypothetical protein
VKIFSIAAMLGLTLTACEGRSSNLDAASPGGRIMYPITAEQADGVLSRAMTATFPETPVATLAGPNKGYMATISFAMDSHRFTATAVPAAGLRPDGSRAEGYAFTVSDYGTIPITASRRSSALFQAINQDAAAITPPLRMAGN